MESRTLAFMLQQIRLSETQEKVKQETAVKVSLEDRQATLLNDLGLFWPERTAPEVRNLSQGLEVSWRSRFSGALTPQVLCTFNNSSWSTAGGLEIAKKGDSYFLRLSVPGTELRRDSGDWGPLSQVEDYKKVIYPSGLRKLLPNFPFSHGMFAEAAIVLDEHVDRMARELLLSFERKLAQLEHTKAQLQTRMEEIGPPPMEALAEVAADIVQGR